MQNMKFNQYLKTSIIFSSEKVNTHVHVNVSDIYICIYVNIYGIQSTSENNKADRSMFNVLLYVYICIYI